MLLRNFKSATDEIAKRNLANELLQVEINNASIYDERLSKYQDKNAPPPVPPQFKSAQDQLRDVIKLERDAIDGVMDIGFSYSDASTIVSKLGQGEKLIQLIQGLPFIKGDITKKFNPKLISPAFFEGYLQNYFDEIGISFGFNFDRNGGMDVANLSEVKQVLPQKDTIEGFIQFITGLPMSGEIMDEIIVPLQNYANVALTPAEEVKLNTGTMTPKTRQGIFKRIKGAITEAGIPAPVEISQAYEMLQRAQNNDATELVFNQLGVALANRVSGMTKSKLRVFTSIKGDINSEVPDPDAELTEATLETDVAEESSIKLPTPTEEQMREYINRIKDVIDDAETEVDVKKIIYKAVSNVVGFYPDIEGKDETLKAGAPLNLEQLRREITKGFIKSGQPPAFPIREVLKDFFAFMEQAISHQNDKATKTSQRYLPDAHRYYEKEVNGMQVGFGFAPTGAVRKPIGSNPATYTPEKFRVKKVEGEGLYQNVIEHLEKDNKEMKELSKSLKKHKEVEKAVGGGYIHKRIPIKKIVGKGIEVEEQPTYRTFGKYVMHIPHLTDKNVLNIKYPSLGSIPSIKPMTISEDYKDFIIDVMNTSRVNEKAFYSLQPHEQKHFERITKGAGLTDVFKLKRSGDDEEKKEVDRFNLLRGNYLGGNNSDDVIKELKGLVVKFINDGRIARHEGLNLLMELSI